MPWDAMFEISLVIIVLESRQRLEGKEKVTLHNRCRTYSQTHSHSFLRSTTFSYGKEKADQNSKDLVQPRVTISKMSLRRTSLRKDPSPPFIARWRRENIGYPPSTCWDRTSWLSVSIAPKPFTRFLPYVPFGFISRLFCRMHSCTQWVSFWCVPKYRSSHVFSRISTVYWRSLRSKGGRLSQRSWFRDKCNPFSGLENYNRDPTAS